MQVMQDQAWASHSQLFSSVAWSPCSQPVAVGLGQPLQGSPHLLVLDSSLSVLQRHELRAMQLAWAPCSSALAALHATHHSRSGALKLQLHSVEPSSTPQGSAAAGLQCTTALGEDMQRLLQGHQGVRSVQWSQQGSFMLLSSWRLCVAVSQQHQPSYPSVSARTKYTHLSWHSANPMLWAAWAPLGDRVIVVASSECRQGRPPLEAFVMRIVGGTQLQQECVLAPLMRGLIEALEMFGALLFCADVLQSRIMGCTMVIFSAVAEALATSGRSACMQLPHRMDRRTVPSAMLAVNLDDACR